MTRLGADLEIWHQRLRKELPHSLPGQSFTVLTAPHGQLAPCPSRHFRRPCHLRHSVDTRS